MIAARDGARSPIKMNTPDTDAIQGLLNGARKVLYLVKI